MAKADMFQGLDWFPTVMAIYQVQLVRIKWAYTFYKWDFVTAYDNWFDKGHHWFLVHVHP